MYVFGKFKTSMVLFHSMHNAYQDIGDQITGLKYRKQDEKSFITNLSCDMYNVINLLNLSLLLDFLLPMYDTEYKG